ncbi:type I-E CRISPR-associated protein Cse1/CasA [Haloechinothrix salitolerans]|uniref:Type I-E CRISPR-associated protein Cse1/CasA n=1 Tax=Haloechinothrix salitolerans TaxID=926830 RepID=A0ABW2C021_9PSEU
MTSEAGFNLLDEPWIIALSPDGREDAFSIIDIFEQAPRLSVIGGEVPTQAFAITRLLLAYLHRAIEGPADQAEWARLWNVHELPMDAIRAYADRVRSRFNLFDDEAPFFQVSGLRTEKGETSHPRKLVADVPDPGRNNLPLFTMRSVANVAMLSADEAARWLLHVHAFDPTGTKSGAAGDRKMKDGKGYGSSIGWSGQLGGVLAEGNDLRETLLLNLLPWDATNYVRIGGANDLPPWERDPDTAAWSEDRPPRGAIDLYAWQTRRVRLVGDRSGVTGVVLANGDRIQSQNRHGVDPHTAWCRRKPQSTNRNDDVYIPQTHDPTRSVWRGIGALLPSVSPRSGGKGAQRYLAPGVLKCVSDLVGEGHLPDEYIVKLRALGAKYKAQNTTFAEIIEDTLPMPLVLLREDHPDAGRTAERAVKDADNAGSCLWWFAEHLAQAAGAEAKSGAVANAVEALYSALEQPYRRWLAQFGPDRDLAVAEREWQASVRAACLPIASELITAAPTTAWTGRLVNQRLVNVPIAEAWFTAALRKALPHAFPRRDETTEVAG